MNYLALAKVVISIAVILSLTKSKKLSAVNAWVNKYIGPVVNSRQLALFVALLFIAAIVVLWAANR
jgi:hypothetical protein